MTDIFISYSREDREKARQLAEVFEQNQWAVWWDKNVAPGQQYAQEITEKLAAAKAVVVLWSRYSIKSIWVKDEAQEGASRGILVSILIEEVNIPLG